MKRRFIDRAFTDHLSGVFKPCIILCNIYQQGLGKNDEIRLDHVLSLALYHGGEGGAEHEVGKEERSVKGEMQFLFMLGSLLGGLVANLILRAIEQ